MVEFEKNQRKTFRERGDLKMQQQEVQQVIDSLSTKDRQREKDVRLLRELCLKLKESHRIQLVMDV